MRKVTGFKKDAAPEPGEDPAETRPEGSMGSDLDISYTLAVAQDDLVSIDFSVSTYFQGAAHPNRVSDTLNYDLKNGKQLKLSDLFKPGAKYLQAIANYCIADLKKQASDRGLIEEEIQKGAAAKSKDYKVGPSQARSRCQFRPLSGRPLRCRSTICVDPLLSPERSHLTLTARSRNSQNKPQIFTDEHG